MNGSQLEENKTYLRLVAILSFHRILAISCNALSRVRGGLMQLSHLRQISNLSSW
jgi:hypothetical protein